MSSKPTSSKAAASKQPRTQSPPEAKKKTTADKKASTPTPPEPLTPPTPLTPLSAPQFTVAPISLPVKAKKPKAPPGNIQLSAITPDLDLSDARIPCRITGGKEHDWAREGKPNIDMISYEITQASDSMVLTLFSFTGRVAEAYSSKQLALPVPGDIVIITGVQVAPAKGDSLLVTTLSLTGDVSRTKFSSVTEPKYIAACPYAKQTIPRQQPLFELPADPEDLFKF